MSPGAPRFDTSAVRISFTRCSPLIRGDEPDSAGHRGVRQQGHLAGVFHRDRDVALVLAAVAADPPGADLASVRDELPQQTGVLVVDLLGLVLAKGANFRLWLAQDGLGHGAFTPRSDNQC